MTKQDARIVAAMADCNLRPSEVARREYMHRNTVLYRIRRLQEDFDIPLDDPSLHADLLLGVSLILFETKGPDFFLHTPKNKT